MSCVKKKKKKRKKQQPTTGCISMCAFVFKTRDEMKQMRIRKLYMMMMMMMCSTGSKYPDTEELRKKWTQYFNIRLLSPEMYFDVHYD